MTPYIRIGGLVRTVSGTQYRGEIGIVTGVLTPDEHSLWEEFRLIDVLYTCTGEVLRWSESNLEALN